MRPPWPQIRYQASRAQRIRALNWHLEGINLVFGGSAARRLLAHIGGVRRYAEMK